MATEWLKSIATRYLNSRYKGCFHNVFQCVYRLDSRPVSNAIVWISAPSNAHVSHTQISVKRNGTCSDNTCIVSCVGIGSPLPTVKWMKHNKDVSSSSSKPVYQIITKINATARQSNLVLSKVNKIRVLFVWQLVFTWQCLIVNWKPFYMECPWTIFKLLVYCRLYIWSVKTINYSQKWVTKLLTYAKNMNEQSKFAQPFNARRIHDRCFHIYDRL